MIDITKTFRGKMPRIPFERMAAHVLGTEYELSLVICGDTLAQRMNATYRKKTYRPNVLSFPLETQAGEIFLNVPCAMREARTYQVSLANRLALLYVHGLWHLKGLDHGTRMEKHERETLQHFGFQTKQ